MAFAELASDGQPLFKDGLSRRQWLEATKDKRKQEFIAELLKRPVDEDAPPAITPDVLAKRIEEST